MTETTPAPSARRLTPAAERLLSTAGELFYDRGIGAVGVDLIAETAGTTKKTLYDRFGSKAVLVAMYLQRRAERWHAFVTRRLDELAGRSPAERILAVYDALEEWQAGRSRGCAFVNAYAEIGGSDHPGLPVIRADKQWTRELFVRLARDTDADDPERLGIQLHLLYEGGLVAATAGGDPDGVRHARAAAARLLDPHAANRAPVS